MKKPLTRIMLGVVVVTTAIPVLSSFTGAEGHARIKEQQEQAWKEQVERTKQALKDNDDMALKAELLDVSFMMGTSINLSSSLPRLMRDCEIPPEKIQEVLGKTIRENLPILKGTSDAGKGCAYNEIRSALALLEIIPGADTLALLRECALSNNEDIRRNALRTYERLEGINIISLLLELAIERQFTYDQLDLDYFVNYRYNLAEYARSHSGEQVNVEEKLYAFLIEMLQKTQDPNTIVKLDALLKGGFGNRYRSQRKQFAQKVEEAKAKLPPIIASEPRSSYGIELEKRVHADWLARQGQSNQIQQPKEMSGNIAIEEGEQHQKEPTGKKGLPWKLPLLVGVLIVSGIAVTRYYFTTTRTMMSRSKTE